MILCKKETKQIFVNKYWFDRRQTNYIFTQRHVLKHKVSNNFYIKRKNERKSALE